MNADKLINLRSSYLSAVYNEGMTLLIPTAEPFLFPRGPVGVLLIHGFTGTPKEMRWMGEYLANQGFTTLGIRLVGHATDPQDMLRVRWRDWASDVMRFSLSGS